MRKRVTYMRNPPEKPLKMHQLLRLFPRIFSAPHIPDRPTGGLPDEAIRDIVSARSHGNLRLQWGQYYTRKDVDDRYAALSRFRFAI